MRFLWKWFFRYWRWTSLPILLLASAVMWLSPAVKVDTANIPRFAAYVILAALGIALYYWWKGQMPPVWVAVPAITTPLFLWGFKLLRPDWYFEWRHSEYFVWTICVVVVLGWLSGMPTTVARIARVALVLLALLAVATGAYSKWPGLGLSSPAHSSVGEPQAAPDVSSLVTMVLKEKQVFELVIPPGHRWNLVGTIPTGMWTDDGGRHDERDNLIYTFKVKPPATEVTLEARISKCATPHC